MRGVLPIVLGLTTAIVFGAAALAADAPAPKTDWPDRNPQTLAPGPWKDMVLYGQRLITQTYAIVGPDVRDPKMRYAGNNLSCQNCHLNAGNQRFGMPLVGVYGDFPTFMGRENNVRTLEDRINGCFQRSMNGRPLPVDSKEMKALVAYIQFLSTGVPVGTSVDGRGLPQLKLLTRAADPDRGEKVYAKNCALCHQADGQGKRNGVPGDTKGYLYPPLWGPDSFNDGAGMHRLITAARFIHANMPFGTTYKNPTLSVEDAWDVAAYINSQPRPHRANLDRDYPDRSRKPVDAPFPPYADDFPLAQHQFGPFQPIIDAHKKQ